MPHDCKQDVFPSGTLESLAILIMPTFCPSTHWEMSHLF